MGEQFHILIFEQDENLRCMLQESMQTEIFRTDVFSSASEIYQHLKEDNYQLCIININSTEESSFKLLTDIKTINEDLPVIIASTRPSKEEIIKAYKLGTDDFVRKPFSIDELKARMLAILRRTCNIKKKEVVYYQIGKYLFNTVKQTLNIGDRSSKLTTKEFELLRLLCRHVNQLVERGYALKTIWNDESYFCARSMDVYLTKLRRLLKEDPNIQLINVHGKGYRLEVKKAAENLS